MARGGLLVACMIAALSVSSASGFVFKAGGTGEWRVPAASSSGNNANATSAYNAWAQRNRFRVGDAIAFTYQPGNDSVLLVDKNSYDACDTNTPIDTFSDGNTVFTFTRSGPYYFISGNKDNCNRNEKLIVVVMAARSAVDNGTIAQAPAPNSPFSSPASPPPPPFGIEISPAANPPPNAAAPKVTGVAGTVAFAVGLMLYALV